MDAVYTATILLQANYADLAHKSYIFALLRHKNIDYNNKANKATRAQAEYVHSRHANHLFT
jgi:hypothetical protein